MCVCVAAHARDHDAAHSPHPHSPSSTQTVHPHGASHLLARQTSCRHHPPAPTHVLEPHSAPRNKHISLQGAPHAKRPAPKPPPINMVGTSQSARCTPTPFSSSTTQALPNHRTWGPATKQVATSPNWAISLRSANVQRMPLIVWPTVHVSPDSPIHAQCRNWDP